MASPTRRLSLIGAGFTLVSFAILGLTTPAVADPVKQAPKGQACWLDVTTGEEGCADSLAQLDDSYFESTGRTLIENENAAAQARATGALASYTMSRIYADENHAGASYSYVSPSSTPCATSLYNIDVMPSGWNDRVSSFVSYFGCKTRISENTYQGGAYLGPIVWALTIGAMNDKTSSMWITS